MSEFDFDLLSEALIRAAPCGTLSFPGVLAALARDEVEFPSRPCVRIRLQRGGCSWDRLARWPCIAARPPSLPRTNPRGAICFAPLRRSSRMMSRGGSSSTIGRSRRFSSRQFQRRHALDDVETPDALDLLITSRNHDLKQAVARRADPEEWIFALVSLQTGEGFGGAANYGIARMNGGSSSRAMMALAPAPRGKA